MRRHKRFQMSSFLAGFALTACLILVGCNKGTTGGGTAGVGGDGGKRHKVAFVTNNASDYWTIARKGTEKAAAELPNVNVEFKIDSDGTAAEQQRVVDDLLAKGIEGIARMSPSGWRVNL